MLPQGHRVDFLLVDGLDCSQLPVLADDGLVNRQVWLQLLHFREHSLEHLGNLGAYGQITVVLDESLVEAVQVLGHPVDIGLEHVG